MPYPITDKSDVEASITGVEYTLDVSYPNSEELTISVSGMLFPASGEAEDLTYWDDAIKALAVGMQSTLEGLTVNHIYKTLGSNDTGGTFTATTLDGPFS